MRQGITTRYFGPTNSKGSRIKATARKADAWGKEQSCTIPLDYSLSSERAHAKAAKACAEKLQWFGLWIGGGNETGNGYNYVNIGDGQYRAIADYKASFATGEGSDWFYVMDDEDKALAILIED